MRLIFMLVIALSSECVMSAPSKVASVCGLTGLPVLLLKERSSVENKKKILSALDQFPSKYKKFSSLEVFPIEDTSRVETLIKEINFAALPDSNAKSRSLAFSTHEQKVLDPKAFLKALLDTIAELSPDINSAVQEFLTLKDPQIESSNFRIAESSETGVIYGAVAEISEAGPKKFKREIIISSNASESLPYLLPLVAHELHHQTLYRQKLSNWNDDRKRFEIGIVDEAVAYDIGMKTYLKLAAKNPELFCNWIYVSWLYGDIPVAMSWAMASFEQSLASGHFIDDYAKKGIYEKQTYLLSSDRKSLRADLKNRISKMNLEFVK